MQANASVSYDYLRTVQPLAKAFCDGLMNNLEKRFEACVTIDSLVQDLDAKKERDFRRGWLIF